MSNKDRLDHAFGTAEKHLSVQRLLEPSGKDNNWFKSSFINDIRFIRSEYKINSEETLIYVRTFEIIKIVLQMSS